MLKASVAADHADQAAEDRLAAVLRRRQEQEDDKVASTHLRRNGLPTRVLIDKVRGRWSSGPGGVDRQAGSSSGIIGAIGRMISSRRRPASSRWCSRPFFLRERLEFDDEMVGTIMDKRDPDKAGSASTLALTQGSASTPALTQGSASTPARGGKGGGKGGGRGGMGGDRGGGKGGKGGMGRQGRRQGWRTVSRQPGPQGRRQLS